MSRFTLITFALTACRAEYVAPPENIGQDLDGRTADVEDVIAPEADVVDPVVVEESAPACNYELYVVGLSQEAIDQGYEIGLQCFPTRPTLYLLEDDEATYSYPHVDTVGIGWTIAAAAEGDVVVESVYGSVDFYDVYGNWSDNFDSVQEMAERVWTYGYTTIRSNDMLDLGGNYQRYSTPPSGFDVAIGSYGDFAPITVPKGDAGEMWLSMDLRDLTVTAGDQIVVEQFPVITWHADGVPTVMTKENVAYMPGDNQYTITFE